MSTRVLQQKVSSRARLFRLSVTALLSAVGFILMMLEFPLLPMFSYLKMDFSDLPAILGGVLLGPVYGVLIELAKNLLDLLLKGIGTQMGLGNIQNFLVGVAYVVPLSACMRRITGPKGYGGKGIAFGCSLGVIAMVVVAFLSNLVVAPLYYDLFLSSTMPVEPVVAAGAGAAFTAVKAAILTVIVLPAARYALPPLKKMVDKVR